MKSLVSKQAIWERELAFAQQPAFWLRFALEASRCASFLRAQWERIVTSGAHPLPSDVSFFAPKFVRLHMGIALENAVKGLLLSGPDRARYILPGRISFRNHGHDLIWLFREAGVSLTDDEAFYVSAWAVSAEWFGKYPFPLDFNGVLDEPQPLASSEAVTRRSLRGKRKFMHRDLLHTGIGSGEWSVFEAVFGRLISRLAV